MGVTAYMGSSQHKVPFRALHTVLLLYKGAVLFCGPKRDPIRELPLWLRDGARITISDLQSLTKQLHDPQPERPKGLDTLNPKP